VKMTPKVMMSCQMHVNEGMVVNTQDGMSVMHRKEVMEFLLINHPLDCPVCDQAGECFLQDYSYDHGLSEARFNEDKIKQSKKQVGEKILLYGDRCIMCTRCVRFTREISGGAELMVSERGNGTEIDVFPGIGVNDKLAGNVVDICPVGALLDDEFLFKQRVWDLQSADSVCAGCSRGCNIRIDHNKGVIYRLKPRYNKDVNEYWMCDEGRHGFKFVHADARLKQSQIAGADASNSNAALGRAKDLLSSYRGDSTQGKLAVVISPTASCEEQELLARWARKLNPNSALVRGPVFSQGEEEKFKAGFTISPEKVPNRRGMEAILEDLGGSQITFAQLSESSIEYGAIIVQGGYPWQGWCPDAIGENLRKAKVLIVLDILSSSLTQKADVVLAGVSWAEKSGSFINDQGLQQSFEKALDPLTDDRDDLALLWKLAGRDGEPDLVAYRSDLNQDDPDGQPTEADPVGAGS